MIIRPTKIKMEKEKIKKYGESGILAVLKRIVFLKAKYGINDDDINYFEGFNELKAKEHWKN